MRKSTTSLVMPYKVERGKSSFQCGTKEFKAFQGEVIFPMWDKRIQGKARQGNQAKKPKPKPKLRILNQTGGTLSHWFMPYKVEGGKSSFQYGTKEFKAR